MPQEVYGKVKLSAKFQHIVTLYTVELCEYALTINFSLYVPKNVLGGFDGERVKLLCSTPKRHYTLREYGA